MTEEWFRDGGKGVGSRMKSYPVWKKMKKDIKKIV